MAEQLDIKPKGDNSRLQRAARASWVFPLIAIAFVAFIKPPNLRIKVIIELLTVLLSVIGLGCGVIALFGLRVTSAKKILPQALAGIVISSLLLFIFAMNFIRVRFY